jgi:hypothetical protein
MQAFWNRPLSSKIRIGYCALTDTLLNIFVFVGLTGFVRQLEKDSHSGEVLSDNAIFAIEGCVALLIFTSQWSHSYAKAQVIDGMFVGENVPAEGQAAPLLGVQDVAAEEEGAPPVADVDVPPPPPVADIGVRPSIRYPHIALTVAYKIAVPALFQASVHFSTPSLGNVGAPIVNGLSAPASLLYLIASFTRPDGINWVRWGGATVNRRWGSVIAAGLVSLKTGLYYSAYSVLLVPDLRKYSSHAAGAVSFFTLATIAAQLPVHANNFLRRPPRVEGWLGGGHQIAEAAEALLRTAYVYQFARQSADASRDSALWLAGTNLVIDLAVFLYNHCCPQPQQIEIAGEEEEQVPVEIEGGEQVPVEIAGEEQVPVQVQVLVAPVGEPQNIFLQQEEQKGPQQAGDGVQPVSPLREVGLFGQVSGMLASAKDFMGWMSQPQQPSP